MVSLYKSILTLLSRWSRTRQALCLPFSLWRQPQIQLYNRSWSRGLKIQKTFEKNHTQSFRGSFGAVQEWMREATMWQERGSGDTAQLAALKRGRLRVSPLHLLLLLQSPLPRRVRQALHLQLRELVARPVRECLELAGFLNLSNMLHLAKSPSRSNRVYLKFKTEESINWLFRIPSLCVGTSLDFIERNPCSLASGEEVFIFTLLSLKNHLFRECVVLTSPSTILFPSWTLLPLSLTSPTTWTPKESSLGQTLAFKLQ